MAFTVKLNFIGSNNKEIWDLTQNPEVTIATAGGRIQGTFLPDQAVKTAEDSYTLTLEEHGLAPKLADDENADYEFRVDHLDLKGSAAVSFLANKPHTFSMNATGNTLIARLEVLPPNGVKVSRGVLTLADASTNGTK